MIFRQSSIASLLAYLGVAINYLIFLWLLPEFLETEQIGLYRLVKSTALLLVPFAHLGFGQSSIIRFFPHFKDRPGGESRFFYFFHLLLHVLGLLCFVAFVFLLRIY